MVEVDGGAWELVNPGWYSGTMSTYVSFSYVLTNLDGMPVWTDESCGDNDFTSYEVSMAEWAGSDVNSNSLLPTSMVIHTQVNKHGSLTMWELGKGISAALEIG